VAKVLECRPEAEEVSRHALILGQNDCPERCPAIFNKINLGKNGDNSMSLIIPLAAEDADGLAVITLDDPNWHVLKQLVETREKIDRAKDNVDQAIEHVVARLLPEWPDLSPDELGDASTGARF
jgi:hypothetical protein